MHSGLRYVPDSESLRHEVLYFGEGSATADRDALARAQELAQQGVDMETIRQQTGWFQQQGRWWYEVDDTSFNRRETGGRDRLFFRRYTHPEVERAYPGMAGELEIGGNPRTGGYGEFIEGDEDRPSTINLHGSVGARLNVPLHELQHAIDAEEAALHGPSLPATEDPSEQRAYSTEQRMGLTAEERRRIRPQFGGLRGRGILPPALQFIPDRSR